MLLLLLLLLSHFHHVRLCDPIDGSPPGFSVHGILQARILEWVAISFSCGAHKKPSNCPTLHPKATALCVREAGKHWPGYLSVKGVRPPPTHHYHQYMSIERHGKQGTPVDIDGLASPSSIPISIFP